MPPHHIAYSSETKFTFMTIARHSASVGSACVVGILSTAALSSLATSLLAGSFNA